MLIRSGLCQVVACEAHSKASDIVTLPDILAFALDPVFERPLGVHPWFVAGLEMTVAPSTVPSFGVTLTRSWSPLEPLLSPDRSSELDVRPDRSLQVAPGTDGVWRLPVSR